MSAAKSYVTRSPRRQTGVTLIEALIAALILAIGILGVVSLLAMSKTSQHEGIQRTRAIALADDMMERVRRNPAAVASYDLGLAVPLGNASRGLIQPVPNCVGATCTRAQLATQDLWAWEQLLDGAAATVTLGGAITPTAGLRGAVACIDFTADIGKTNTGILNIVIQWQGLKDTFDAIDGGITCGDDSDAGDTRRQILLSSYIVDETE